MVICTHLAPPVIMESTAALAFMTHILCWSWGMYFSAATSSENDQGSMNFASKTTPVCSTIPSRAAAIQRRLQHPVIRWMAATLDGMVEQTGVVFEAKFMLPWSFSEEVAAEKYMPQLQHNMWVMNAKAAVLSIITGGGKWVEIAIPADPLYQHLLLTAEKKFWRYVEDGEPPRLFGIEPPRPRIEAVRIVDMSASNAWAEFSGVFRRTREAHLEHENAKTELKALMPEDAKEAIGHGIRAKRSKSGAVSFDVLSMEGSRAPLQ